MLWACSATIKSRGTHMNESRDLILVQHQYNNCTTTPHMRVGPSMWDPPSCEGLLYSCCIGVVNLTFSMSLTNVFCCANVVHIYVVQKSFFNKKGGNIFFPPFDRIKRHMSEGLGYRTKRGGKNQIVR
jgi:hypothetical protein